MPAQLSGRRSASRASQDSMANASARRTLIQRPLTNPSETGRFWEAQEPMKVLQYSLLAAVPQAIAPHLVRVADRAGPIKRAAGRKTQAGDPLKS